MFGAESFGSQAFGSTDTTAIPVKTPIGGVVIDDLCTAPAVTGQTIDDACDC